MNPCLGFMVMFEGDFRKVNATIENVVEFTAVSAVLKNGDNDATSLYIDTSPAWAGNLLISDKIGGKAPILPGSYRYLISGTYGGKKRTWYWDILVLPKDISLLNAMDIPPNLDPLAEIITIYEGDNFAKRVLAPGLAFTAAAGSLRSFSDDITATYCTTSASFSDDMLTTHNIGGLAAMPAGDYGYFITGTYDDGDSKQTWYFKIKVLSKQGVL